MSDECVHEWHAFPEGPRKVRVYPEHGPIRDDAKHLYCRNCGEMK